MVEAAKFSLTPFYPERFSLIFFDI